MFCLVYAFNVTSMASFPFFPSVYCFCCMNCLDVFAIICAFVCSCSNYMQYNVCLFPLLLRPAVIINVM